MKNHNARLIILITLLFLLSGVGIMVRAGVDEENNYYLSDAIRDYEWQLKSMAVDSEENIFVVLKMDPRNYKKHNYMNALFKNVDETDKHKYYLKDMIVDHEGTVFLGLTYGRNPRLSFFRKEEGKKWNALFFAENCQICLPKILNDQLFVILNNATHDNISIPYNQQLLKVEYRVYDGEKWSEERTWDILPVNKRPFWRIFDTYYPYIPIAISYNNGYYCVLCEYKVRFRTDIIGNSVFGGKLKVFLYNNNLERVFSYDISPPGRDNINIFPILVNDEEGFDIYTKESRKNHDGYYIAKYSILCNGNAKKTIILTDKEIYFMRGIRDNDRKTYIIYYDSEKGIGNVSKLMVIDQNGDIEDIRLGPGRDGRIVIDSKGRLHLIWCVTVYKHEYRDYDYLVRRVYHKGELSDIEVLVPNIGRSEIDRLTDPRGHRYLVTVAPDDSLIIAWEEDCKIYTKTIEP